MSNWKQPVPTDIRENKEIDTLSRLLFYEVITSCRNTDGIERIFHGNKVIYKDMKRGQCLLKIGEIAEDLKLPRKRIEKSLEIVSKSYNEMQLEPLPFGTIITVKNYDDVVNMKLEKQLEVNSNEIRNEFELNASYKSDRVEERKTVENVSKDTQETPAVSYGNKDVTRLIDGLYKNLDIKLPIDKQARNYASNMLKLITKNDKKDRQWLKEDKWENAKWFAKDYDVWKVQDGYQAQSWKKLYEHFKVWFENSGDISKLMKK
jgi:hypothetical protein